MMKRKIIKNNFVVKIKFINLNKAYKTYQIL